MNEVNADTVEVGDIVYQNPDKSEEHWEKYAGPFKVVAVKSGGSYIAVQRLGSGNDTYGGRFYYSWRFLTKPYEYDELLDPV